MIGLIFAIFFVTGIICVIKIASDASVPKCGTCRQARAKSCATCLHCGAK